MGSHRTLRWIGSVALLAAALANGLFAPGASAAVQPQHRPPSILAVLQVIQDTVEWRTANAAAPSPSDDTGWTSVEDSQSLAAGDEVRTDQGAAARIIHFDGTRTDMMEQSDLQIEQPDTNPQGAMVGRLLQLDGIAVHHAAPADSSAGLAGFQVETLAVVARAEGATVQVQIDPDGTTHVTYVSNGQSGPVSVQSTAAGSTPMPLTPGQAMVFPAPSGARPPGAPRS
ncbi:MAG TPA: hypothetical protein VK066_25985 [Chloroflexota bacterium]|nr:hypothetical protein [Chloroflexota bacterium]